MGTVGGSRLLGDAFVMAIQAFDKMNVVGTLRRGEGSVHFFNIKAAIGEARMASGT